MIIRLKAHCAVLLDMPIQWAQKSLSGLTCKAHITGLNLLSIQTLSLKPDSSWHQKSCISCILSYNKNPATISINEASRFSITLTSRWSVYSSVQNLIWSIFRNPLLSKSSPIRLGSIHQFVQQVNFNKGYLDFRKISSEQKTPHLLERKCQPSEAWQIWAGLTQWPER